MYSLILEAVIVYCLLDTVLCNQSTTRNTMGKKKTQQPTGLYLLVWEERQTTHHLETDNSTLGPGKCETEK